MSEARVPGAEGRDLRATARTDHEIPERAPISIAPGDLVEVGERDTTWPAFVFIATGDGDGWVPERHLAPDRPRAEVLHHYDTTELPLRAGEAVTLLDDDPESGWSWCVDARGRSGWVPHAVLGLRK